MLVILLISFVSVFFLIRYIAKEKHSDWKTPSVQCPDKWLVFLTKEVPFFNTLNPVEKKSFALRVQEFLLNCRITGIGTTINDDDRLLIAASAIIPIFSFPDWRYWNLFEILVYPKSFDEQFEFEGNGKPILGMVGSGYMEGKMILSKEAIHLGFQNETDKSNTVIHEFVHLIDKSDGETDGIPDLLLDKQYVLPWLELMHKKMQQIIQGKSDIDSYGLTNKAEFFAVVAEYFFERPALLEEKHPVLYKMLCEMFEVK
jgi:Mlc titration factor MtfA (ptsG expression regulator)